MPAVWEQSWMPSVRDSYTTKQYLPSRAATQPRHRATDWTPFRRELVVRPRWYDVPIDRASCVCTGFRRLHCSCISSDVGSSQ